MTLLPTRSLERGSRVLAKAAICAVLAAYAAFVNAQTAAPAKLADAKPGDVRLFVSGSLRAPVLAVQSQLEQVTGRKIVLESSESRILQKEIDAGQAFEAALLITTVIKDLVAKGSIIPGSEVQLGFVRVGVSVRGNAPHLDVSTPATLKQAILGAHGIRRYYGVGVSVPVLDNLFTKLDLDEATKDKMIRLGSEHVVAEEPLPPGQYELIINLISAIKPMAGWTYIGAIPEQFQMPASHSAGIGASGDAAMGRKVMAVIESSQFKEALTAAGITAQ
jgi:molybdate transport system substrate-binding protein